VDALQIKAYLDRIGCDFTRPDRENLARLQNAHLFSVPYENLDILKNIPIKLDEASLFDKIVTRRRGGYCFEVNNLFGILLRALGYEVKDLAARYLRGEEGVPMRRHHVLKVSCEDGVYLCDVGVGEPLPMEPVPYLTKEPFTDSFGGVYFFREDEFLGYVLCEEYKGGTRDVISFAEENWVNADYATISFWCERSPDSFFNKDIILAIRQRPNARITLSGHTMHTFKDGSFEERVLTDEELDKEIKDTFGIAESRPPVEPVACTAPIRGKYRLHP